MCRSLIFVLTLFAVCLEANAWCASWNKGETMNLCKSPGGKDCIKAKNNDYCIDIDESQIFVSGFTSNDHACRLYTGLNCTPDMKDAYYTVYATIQEFLFPPRSFKCFCY